MPKRKRTFEVFIEAKLTVLAFDASSAQRKIERAFSRGNQIDEDVTATGDLWTYDAVGREAPSPRPTRLRSSHSAPSLARARQRAADVHH